MKLPPWVLTEPVDVTLVYQDLENGVTLYLVEKTQYAWGGHPEGRPPVAIVLNFADVVEINGQPFEEQVENEFWDLSNLIDDVGRWNSPDAMMTVGMTRRSEPIF